MSPGVLEPGRPRRARLPITRLERVGIVIVGLLLAAALIALLSGFFNARDQAGLDTVTPPGHAFNDLGNGHLARGAPPPVYDSVPPTSGAHVPEPIVRDNAELNDNQLLQALSEGNVVVAYGSARPPAGVRGLARALAPAFSPALAAVGQAVILDRRPGTSGLIVLAWAHMLTTGSAGDPALREFVSYWLGRGAPR